MCCASGGLTRRARWSRRCRWFAAGQDHEHGLAFDARVPLNHRHISQTIGHLLEQLTPKLWVRQLAPAEEHRHLDFVAVFEELDRALGLSVDVVFADLRPEPNLLELDDLLVLAGLPLLLGLLVLEAPVVQQPANRRDDIRGYLDQVEVLRLG